MIGSQRYAIDVSAVATPLRAQPAALQILERKPDRRVWASPARRITAAVAGSAVQEGNCRRVHRFSPPSPQRRCGPAGTTFQEVKIQRQRSSGAAAETTGPSSAGSAPARKSGA